VSRIQATFQRLKEPGRAAFMPYVVGGDPDLETSRRILLSLEAAGADLVEIGIPFSDPLADGPTNQLGAERALKAGATLSGILDLVRDVRRESSLPILLMGYCNPFFRYGLEAFCQDASAAGADGLIIPDLPPDNAVEIRSHADACGLDTVFLIAPTSTPARLELVAREASGFVYAVSLTGVTGALTELPPELAAFVARAREHIDLPICVGFGISTPAMARQVGSLADGVIVGSAIVRRIGEAAAAGRDSVPEVEALVAGMAAVLRQGRIRCECERPDAFQSVQQVRTGVGHARRFPG